MSKTCGKCGEAKPVADFHRNRASRDGLHYCCKPCWSVYMSAQGKKHVVRKRESLRAWRKANPQKDREAQLRWRKKHAPHVAQYERLRRVGMTPDLLADMLTSQENRCAICRTSEPCGKGTWHLDHDHGSGAVRGLLCHYCNLMLGMARDNPSTLAAAIEYLRLARPDAPLRIVKDGVA